MPPGGGADGAAGAAGGGDGGASPSSSTATVDPLSIAYYCTGHGLGHATRAIEVCKHLVERGHSVTVITGAPARVFLQEVPSARFVLRKAVLDAGAKQLDPFTVDVRGSLEQYHATAVVNREAMLAAEVQWLQSNHMDLVVSDVVPIVCAAAAAAGIPAVCVSNFSWDFIYSEYLTTLRKSEFRHLVWQIAQDYSAAALLLRLPGYVPMPAFTAIEDVPLVVRHARKFPAQVRQELGLPLDVRLAVLIHGGHRAELDVQQDFLPPGWLCVACNGGQPLGPGPLPPNFRLAPADVYTPDLVAASDCIIGKIGYGIVSECLAHARPLVFVRRDFFNEEPFLRKKLEVHGAAIEMKRRDFLEGHWGPYLQRACSLNVRYTEPTNGAEVVAARLEQIGHGQRAPAANPLVRLRDTVVFGYLMASSKHGRVDVPDWYVNGADPNRRRGSYRSLGDAAAAPLQNWHLVEGNPQLLQQLPDTLAFLQLLRGLDAPPGCSSAGGAHDSGSSVASDGANGAAGSQELPEVRAARVLFRFDDELLVTRAPGRLDVMGGIADYSGSLVLQMPIAEACHVALQLHPLQQQRVWRHVQARHDKLGGPRPTLLVVSLHADDTNRAPTFDLDLDDLFNPDGSPIPYASLCSYFQADPAGRWGAYVAGCLLVLAHEKGARFPDGISVLVASDVPEGKGVSSSAALEVAVMSAVAAAHNIELRGRELALLCQKVENLCVGAPCGIMDQMTAALGEAGQLTALLCQPAELQAGVQIPPQVRFWGIDSGIRHSVGGSDYRSVRVGAFMGLKIVRQVLQRQHMLLTSQPTSSVAAVLTEVTSANKPGPLTSSPLSTPGSSSGGALTGSVAAAAAAAVGAAGSSRSASPAVLLSPAAGGGFFHSGPITQQRPPITSMQQHHQQQQQLSTAAAPAPLPLQAAAADRASSSSEGAGAGGLSGCGRVLPTCAVSHLANTTPSEYHELYEAELPLELLGADFLHTYGPHLDTATAVDPHTVYAVRQPTAHPILENHRVNCFQALLAASESLADAAADARSRRHHRDSHHPSQALLPTAASDSSTGSGQPGTHAAVEGSAVVAAAAFQGLSVADGGGSRSRRLSAAAGDSSGSLDSSLSSSSPFVADAAAAAASAARQTQQPALASSHTASAAASVPAALQGPLDMLGELMFQSHASYSACGLGSDGTNRLVHIVRQHIMAARRAGRQPALFGAKITGGGSGGTVCVLGLSGAAGQAAVDAVAAQYREETGYQPFVFAGSSWGAARFGHLRLKRKP